MDVLEHGSELIAAAGVATAANITVVVGKRRLVAGELQQQGDSYLVAEESKT